MKFLKHPAVLFSLYMALIGGSYLPYFTFLPIRISYHILITGLLIWWIWKDGLPATPLLYPLMGMAAVSFVSAIASIDPRISLEAWWHWLANGLLGLMLIHWMRRSWGETVFKSHFVVAGVIVAAAFLQWALMPGQRVSGPFLLINITGAYAAALIIPAFVWAWKEKQAWLLFVAFGLIAVLYMNDSRGAFISAGVGLVVFLFLRYRVKLPVLLIGGAIAILLAFGVIQKSEVVGHASGDTIRAELWRSAVQMLTARPWNGVGPGLFGQAYRQIRITKEDNMSGAHDWYLNILAETGLPGGVATLATGAMFLYSIPKRRNAKQDAVLAALVGIFAHLLFDNYPSANFVFLVNLYAAYLLASGKQRLGGVYGKVGAEALAAGLLIILGLFLACFDTAQVYYERSLWTGSLEDAQTAATIDPKNRIYSIHVARLEGDMNRVHELDPTLSTGTRLDVYGIINFGRFLW